MTFQLWPFNFIAAQLTMHWANGGPHGLPIFVKIELSDLQLCTMNSITCFIFDKAWKLFAFTQIKSKLFKYANLLSYLRKFFTFPVVFHWFAVWKITHITLIMMQILYDYIHVPSSLCLWMRTNICKKVAESMVSFVICNPHVTVHVPYVLTRTCIKVLFLFIVYIYRYLYTSD